MRVTRSMRRTAKRIADSVTAEVSGPVSPTWLCEQLCREMSGLRQRPIELRFIDFPPDSATGLALVYEDHDRIFVDSRTTGVQRVVVTGHELWHLTQDGHGSYRDGAVAAARMLNETDDIEHAWRQVVRAAARSHCEDDCEQQAEAFGLTLGGRLLPWVTDAPGACDAGPRNGLLGRIQTSFKPY